MRHAWLIIAHNEFGILQRLISMLDSPQSDFYVHIDRKVPVLPTLAVQDGRLFLLADRLNVSWGSVSQIRVELHLLETARENGPYAHYHILSGTHLPLKNLDELLAFYDAHANEEIMRFWPKDPGDADFKMRRYHFPLRHFKSSSPPLRKLDQLSWKVALRIQKVLGIRHMQEQDFRKTDNWLSLTEDACGYLVDHKEDILKKYRWTFCGDEYFAATELLACGDRFRLLDCRQLLHVEFLGDTPRTFGLKDYPKLQNTDYLWARKFTEYGH